jgi:hypothetical protein
MKTVILLYLPGHAGNFLARLFSLGEDTMPLLRKDQLDHHLDQGTPVPDNFDRLENYRFGQVTQEFDSWQQFHRAHADFLENAQYRLLNVFCGLHYSRIVLPVHPGEFENYFVNIDPTEFYYVDLDLHKWGAWVSGQQEKLGFRTRGNENQQFETYKKQYHMRSINLTKMLASEQAFVEEYMLVCNQMNIEPMLEQARQLRQDWYSVRVAGQI